MASSRTIATRLCSRIGSVPLNHVAKPSSSLSQLPSPARIPRSISRVVRLPVELSGAMSLMPLHTAIASSLLRSSLAVESWSWGLVPQGLSMPL
ncbi:hypothetical protein MLD38_014788 [Melastoma candidum]|uniref:Uncharacterized protein n=1 Tax=Melastoma candidum TaxID=119954 RepID=A0ACB9RF95_9MYRT|nr:hypothetical protein MLD38_014788 [Melastoma candidum]